MLIRNVDSLTGVSQNSTSAPAIENLSAGAVDPEAVDDD
jgi:hypothetical protein